MRRDFEQAGQSITTRPSGRFSTGATTKRIYPEGQRQASSASHCRQRIGAAPCGAVAGLTALVIVAPGSDTQGDDQHESDAGPEGAAEPPEGRHAHRVTPVAELR